MQLSQQEYLAEILVRHGVVPPDRIDGMLQAVRERPNQGLVELIVASKVADERRVSEVLAAESEF